MPSSTSPIRLLHDLPRVTVRQRSVSEMANNVYVLTSKTSGTQVLIDAADDVDAVRELLESARADTPCELRLAVIITTHQHWDHVRALAGVVEATGVPTAAGTEDAAAIEAGTGVAAKVLLNHGDTATFDGISLAVVGLRGHTPGSVALVYEPEDGPPLCFSGDSLFPGGVGNTQQDPARFDSLFTDVVERLFDRYPDDMIVHPGHGDSTTLGAERPHLAEWRERGW
ncbi:MBL fold metallo-hydrolase [Citricoccus sp. SGAir0253]|uniref:MBL fold metallo-hydrolase n=1 Tax=Citricoccus sp. SGAir0253 TaxID=2567881 RepID=UPI0010CD5C22|nr:MBL fold metallo-hydrolase [Citricoccus sp. SGAir0253]QCU78130.1 MBL fold metallo-hydrolase [Citricoccus sp. SGAir0253]